MCEIRPGEEGQNETLRSANLICGFGEWAFTGSLKLGTRHASAAVEELASAGLSLFNLNGLAHSMRSFTHVRACGQLLSRGDYSLLWSVTCYTG